MRELIPTIFEQERFRSNQIKLAHNKPVSPVTVTGPSATQNSPFLPRDGLNHRQYSLHPPMEFANADPL